MTKGLGANLLILMVLAVLAFAFYEVFTTNQRSQRLVADVTSLQQRVDNLDGRLRRTQERIKELEKTSIKGVVESANRTIVDGWSAMMATLEGELRKAREQMSQKEGDAGSDAQAPVPPAESGAGEAGSADQR